MPGQGGVFQRGPEGRLGALAEQQEAGLQAAPHRHGRQKHHPLREGIRSRNTKLCRVIFHVGTAGMYGSDF